MNANPGAIRLNQTAAGEANGDEPRRVVAVLSMLHEAAESNSATREFQARSVIEWTLSRLSLAARLAAVTIMCWDDQLAAVRAIAQAAGAGVHTHGMRRALPQFDARTIALRWLDGWRSGLLNTCDFDLGFCGAPTWEVAQRENASAIVLVDPSAGLVDPRLIDDVIEHAAGRPDRELIFSPAAPGLGGALLHRSFVERLGQGDLHPGKILHYLPDHPVHDPCSSEGCCPVAAPIARTLHRFKLDSDRQVRRIGQAVESLGGRLLTTNALELVERMNATTSGDVLPRELVLELTTRRATHPTFSTCDLPQLRRDDLPLEVARALIRQFAAADDARLTLAGVGDPLLCPMVFDVIAAARDAGIRAIHVETDLVRIDPQDVQRLVHSGIDILSFHLPATTVVTYQAMMGIDAMAMVLENLKQLLLARQASGGASPLFVPIFTKCGENLGEMETWYDQWLRALGSAVIRGPRTFSGLIPDQAVADMSASFLPLTSSTMKRLTILSDGRAVTHEEDVLGQSAVGNAAAQSLEGLWQAALDHVNSSSPGFCRVRGTPRTIATDREDGPRSTTDPTEANQMNRSGAKPMKRSA